MTRFSNPPLFALLVASALALAGCTAPDEAADDAGGPGEPTTSSPPASDQGAGDGGGSEPPASTPPPADTGSCEGERECLVFVSDAPEWSVERTDCVSDFSCAEEGKELLVLTLVIENAGEEDIDTNPFSFKLYTAATVLSPDSSTYSTDNPMDGSASLRAGAQTSGQLVYQVRQGEEAEQICWEGYSSRDFGELQFCHEFADGAMGSA